MHELKVGDRNIPIKATLHAQLMYRQQFNSDMTSDFLKVMASLTSIIPGAKAMSLAKLAKMKVSMEDVTVEDLSLAAFDTIGLLQLVWAMAAAADKDVQSFAAWLNALDDDDLSVAVFDKDFLTTVLEVAADGLFRGAGQPAPRVGRK